MAVQRVTIVGTGLIGASIGLALREGGFSGTITGIDSSAEELRTAMDRGAITHLAQSPQKHRSAIARADLVVLAVPVLKILDWMETSAPLLHEGQLLTDVGSTKQVIADAARRLMPGQFLPGHPMAGKESGGAALADAALFRGATWLFTPLGELAGESATVAAEWRAWVSRFGAAVLDMAPGKHDALCAWVSHLPQMVSTAMSALLEDTFGDAPEVRAVGGRALREMTRLGASPFSMWRDVAHTNEAEVAKTLLALEQRLQHIRESLRSPELRDEFAKGNAFRERL